MVFIKRLTFPLVRISDWMTQSCEHEQKVIFPANVVSITRSIVSLFHNAQMK